MNKQEYIKPETIIVIFDAAGGLLVPNSNSVIIIDDGPVYGGGLGAKIEESNEVEY
jgi:hypothetical protein